MASMDSNLYVLNGSDGSLEWRYQVEHQFDSSPSLGDIDGDGSIEAHIELSLTNGRIMYHLRADGYAF
jgi:hypothetical protein